MDTFPNSSLSSLELIRMISKEVGDRYEPFVAELMKNGMQLPSIYRDWQGIDSEFCVVLIHYSMEHTKDRTLMLPSFSKGEVSAVYRRVHGVYSAACQSIKLPFVPCIKGLATVLMKQPKRW